MYSPISKEHCEALDRDDPLAAFRNEFALPPGTIYLNGNSLGAMPKRALEIANRTIVDEWGRDLINSWNTADWFHLPQRLGDKLAAIIGADPGEVVVTDSTGINVFKTMSAALALRPERSVIVMEGSNFPTDNYTVQGLVQQLGDRHTIRFAEKDQLADAIDDDVAVVCLTDVHYKTGHILDMQAITQKAQACGAITVWDLCHSAGAIPVDLNGCNADFAVGCTYKYLNGGPGSPGFIFAAKRHHGSALQPLTGWWGHASPFAFERDYRPAPGIDQMLSGTQAIVSLAMVEAGLDITARASMNVIRDKSKKMGDMFIQLIEKHCADYGFSLVSPRDAEERASQVALEHEQGYPIMRALIDNKVVGDFRAPNILRFGFAPLYLRYVDVWNTVDTLQTIMHTEKWREEKYNTRLAVT
ncbi:MAG: kynureninase [Pseudomonadales bacterium]